MSEDDIRVVRRLAAESVLADVRLTCAAGCLGEQLTGAVKHIGRAPVLDRLLIRELATNMDDKRPKMFPFCS